MFPVLLSLVDGHRFTDAELDALEVGTTVVDTNGHQWVKQLGEGLHEWSWMQLGQPIVESEFDRVVTDPEHLVYQLQASDGRSHRFVFDRDEDPMACPEISREQLAASLVGSWFADGDGVVWTMYAEGVWRRAVAADPPSAVDDDVDRLRRRAEIAGFIPDPADPHRGDEHALTAAWDPNHSRHVDLVRTYQNLILDMSSRLTDAQVDGELGHAQARKIDNRLRRCERALGFIRDNIVLDNPRGNLLFEVATRALDVKGETS